MLGEPRSLIDESKEVDVDEYQGEEDKSLEGVACRRLGEEPLFANMDYYIKIHLFIMEKLKIYTLI